MPPSPFFPSYILFELSNRFPLLTSTVHIPTPPHDPHVYRFSFSLPPCPSSFTLRSFSQCPFERVHWRHRRSMWRVRSVTRLLFLSWSGSTVENFCLSVFCPLSSLIFNPYIMYIMCVCCVVGTLSARNYLAFFLGIFRFGAGRSSAAAKVD